MYGLKENKYQKKKKKEPKNDKSGIRTHAPYEMRRRPMFQGKRRQESLESHALDRSAILPY